MRRILIGIDLGGTKIEGAGIEWGGARPGQQGQYREVVARRRVDTKREEGYEAILGRAAGMVRELREEALAGGADEVRFGVGMPGGITAGGLVKNSNTLCLNGRDFRGDLRREAGEEIRFENDANCFALAEARMGSASAEESRVLFGVIMGTGCGGGLVLDGKVWGGLHGIGGEWGHHAVFPESGLKCYCGQTGCAELFLSGTAIEADYKRRAGVGRKVAEIVSRRQTDPAAAEAVELLLEAFGRGLANVIDILDPSAIVIGGGVSNVDLLYTEGRERVASRVFNDELRTPILKNRLGDSAGVLGAAMLNAGD